MNTCQSEPAAADAAGQDSRRLSQSFSTLWSELAAQKSSQIFDVVVVGSGYGGSVAAEALAGLQVGPEDARRPLSVCVLERGQEYLPGDFPSRFAELPGHVRLADQNTGKVRLKHQGLFDFRLGDDVVALVANGLGGGSLINAGVMLKPALGDFKSTSQMSLLVQALQQGGYFETAALALGAGTKALPNTIERHADWPVPGLKKNFALKQLAGGHGFELPRMTVAMAEHSNSAGVKLSACTLCGDCMTGCNVGAKESLDTNLLEKSWRQGARIICGATVLSLRRSSKKDSAPAGETGKFWVLRVVHSDPKLQAREPEYLRLFARKVVLAAGSLGSPELLLRSRADKLQFSPRLGEGFSCNGDNIAAVHGLDIATEGCADEALGVGPGQRHVGPTITGSIAMGEPQRGFKLQEFAVPGALKQVFEEIVSSAHALAQLSEADLSRHGQEPASFPDPSAVDPAKMARSLLVGIIGHDDASGSLLLPRPYRPLGKSAMPAQQGNLRIRWPQARHAAHLHMAQEDIEKLLASYAGKLPGRQAARVVANPFWRLLPPSLADLVDQPLGPVLTVHPLGGCPMAADVDAGVVDEFGRVFDARPQADDLWQGSLVVLDGSIMPGSLGVNPALTIAATALRAIENLIRTWQPDWAIQGPVVCPSEGHPQVLPPYPRHRRAAPPPPPPSQPTEIEIVERLSGRVDIDTGSGQPRECVLELTLAFEPVPVRRLMSSLRRSLTLQQGDDRSRLRLYDAQVWQELGLRFLTEQQRCAHVLLDARLSGRLDLLQREDSSSWRRKLRAVLAWLANRGWRDIWQKLQENRHSKGSDGYLTRLLNMASHAGEVRRFDYALQIGTVLRNEFKDEQGRLLTVLSRGDAVTGCKRLTYDRRANPWRQLTEMKLTAMPAWRSSGPGLLCLDARFLAEQEYPLLRITRQQDQAKALAELLSLGLHLARLIVGIHLWTFRKPDAPSPAAAARAPERLPGRIEGLPEPEVTELVVDHLKDSGQAVKVRLTRYRPASHHATGNKAAARPLVMIHGYSVGGNTFTHPSLAPSAAAYFCAQGRDVWVLDLRTSIGMDKTVGMPWAMEQAALIDLPAALLHIRHQTGQPADVLAHCIGCVMLSMALLTRAADITSSRIELGVDSWLTSEHLGILDAFNWRGGNGAPHFCIARIVLSQKGPLLRYTDSNVFRSFILQSIRRMLFNDDYQFRAPRNPGVADQLLDRLLASLPYPDEDYDVENPRWPWQTRPWTATRHRMDALYGRDFNAANLSEESLAAIDDLFGTIHMDTVAQVIHFTRFNAITSQRGRGEFVTRKRLRERWGAIPTLTLHGKQNGLVDVSTQDLLRARLVEAGVPVTTLSSDLPLYASLGHQDVLIGRQSAAVFADIENFLRAAAPADLSGAPAADSSWVIVPAWLGPRLDLQAGNEPLLRIAAMARPDQGDAGLGLFPVCRHQPASGARPSFELLGSAIDIEQSVLGSSRQWLTVGPNLAGLLADPAADSGTEAGPESGYLALLIYSADEFVAGGHRPNSQLRGPRPGGDDEAIWAALRLWLAQQETAVLEAAFVRAGDLERALSLGLAAAPPVRLSFALASCQYPAGLFDRLPAQASLRRLNSALDEAGDVDFVLFVGDQIYADASAGLMDATRRDELFEAPHDKALRDLELQRLLRRRPVQMLLDDHELCDNWEPLSTALTELRPEQARRNERCQNYGMQAWSFYQRMRPVPRPPTPSLPHTGAQPALLGDFEFSVGGHPFYFADTRSGRRSRELASKPELRQILHDDQWLALETWLRDQGDKLKFVATPALLLPRRAFLQQDLQRCASSDAWDGFPASMTRLFAFLIKHSIRNTVFVSGDEHHSLFAEIWLNSDPVAGKPGLKLLCVHSSALYAPYPFANGQARDLALNESFNRDGIDVRVCTTLAAGGDGYARLQVLGDSSLEIAFVKADSGLPTALHMVSLT